MGGVSNIVFLSTIFGNTFSVAICTSHRHTQDGTMEGFTRGSTYFPKGGLARGSVDMGLPVGSRDKAPVGSLGTTSSEAEACGKYFYNFNLF